MKGKKYKHSAYWYAKNYGWTYSERETLIGRYLDLHSFPAYERSSYYKKGNSFLDSFDRYLENSIYTGFDIGKYKNLNPFLMGVLVSADIGIAVTSRLKKIADPVEREKMKLRLKQTLRQAQRPLYYDREVRRRRLFAEERRKITKRRTNAPMPTPEEIREAWAKRKDSREAMVRLGGLLDDLDCYVDNHLKIDEYGNIKGRGSGIRGWLKACTPELSLKYKTLMRYKALAVRLRQLAEIKEPHSVAELLDAPEGQNKEGCLANIQPIGMKGETEEQRVPRDFDRKEISRLASWTDEMRKVREMMSEQTAVFSSFFEDVDRHLSPETVFIEDSKCPARVKRRQRKK